MEKLLEDMPLKQKVTQMIMPDFRKWQEAGQESPQDLTKVNAEVAEAIDKYDFGGVILFAENVKETKQTLALTQDMQKAAIENKANNGKIPLLLAIDQEGASSIDWVVVQLSPEIWPLERPMIPSYRQKLVKLSVESFLH